MVTKERKAQYSRDYRARKRQTETLFSQNLQTLLTSGKDIVVELVRATNSNPLIGVLISIVSVDILSRAHIIDSATAAGCYVALGFIDGASVAGTVISDFTDVFKLFAKSPTNDLVRPSATTIVYPRAGPEEDLQTRVGEHA